MAVADFTAGAHAAFRPDQTYQTASVVKAAVLATLLLRAQDSKRPLNTDDRDLAHEMIVHSDNDVTDTLWRAVGGASDRQ